MINTDDEQTFRPKKIRLGNYKNLEMPLQSNEKTQNAIMSSHTNLIHDKNYYEQRNERREQEYREVMQKRDKQPYQEYVKDLEA